MNRLSKEKAAYLRKAANQRIDWYPWSDEAFERARLEDKPVFMSTGAVWCHWCHVMAKESFTDEEIIKILNDNFINIKLDRDERPDIDRIYQRAVSAMGEGGGWPLSVFLTPDRKPFFGGTYFPPEDALGRPGFKKVLKSVIEFYGSERTKIIPYVEKLISAVTPETGRQKGIDKTSIYDAVRGIISELDEKNGGFGTAPKFPMSGTIEFLINRYALTGEEVIGSAVRKTLGSMAQGGFHDHLGGGFHRYSTDESWTIPHFEKMADDNAWLLRNYIDAYAVYGDEQFKNIAEGIISFIHNVLYDGDGGFYASQDADVTPDDEGGYFTWTESDFTAVLDEEEFNILRLHLLDSKGAMHHNREKKVLFNAMGADEIARQTGKDFKVVTDVIRRGKDKLIKARNKRETPFVDKTFYSSLNGMLISALLKAYRVLADKSIKESALKGLDRIEKISMINDELYHSEGVKGMLEDYINVTDAFASAYEITGNIKYLNQADKLMSLCIEKFMDKEEGGFFETEGRIMGLRLKGIEDLSHPSANSISIFLLIKLYHMTGKEMYYQNAEKALMFFSSKAEGRGIIAGYYFAALDSYYNNLRLSVHTNDDAMIKTALSVFRPYVSLIYGEDKGFVLPCSRDACYEPIDETRKLKDLLTSREFVRND